GPQPAARRSPAGRLRHQDGWPRSWLRLLSVQHDAAQVDSVGRCARWSLRAAEFLAVLLHPLRYCGLDLLLRGCRGLGVERSDRAHQPRIRPWGHPCRRFHTVAGTELVDRLLCGVAVHAVVQRFAVFGLADVVAEPHQHALDDLDVVALVSLTW